MLLRAGALPAPLTVVEQRSVGPELGADSIRAGAISLAVGFVLVIAFMAFFYGLFGWFANLCLVVNLVLMLGIMSLLQATLTLPGMAGILLTLGMAVDANILINERIREEQKHGRPPLAALEHGFSRAYSTIFDSNATAFLAHVMLFVFGSGPVQGFRGDHHRRHRHLAVHRLDADPAAGVALVCRARGRSCCRSEVVPMFIKPRFRLVPDNTRIQFMRGPVHGADRLGDPVHRLGRSCSSIPGLNLGIDFSGGVVMEVRTDGPADFAQIRAALARRAHPRPGRAALRRPVGGADPARRPADRAGDAGGGGTGARPRWRRACPAPGSMRTDAVGASVSAPSCSATACWRWASAC